MATPPSDPLSTAEHPLSVSSVPQGIAHVPTAGPPAQAIPPVPSTQASSTSTNTLKSNLNSNTVPIYTFKFYNAGNNQITCMTDPSLPTFTITTTRGFLDLPNHSVVICTVPGVDGARNVAQGELDWKKEKITVGNVSKSMKEAKKRIGGVLSLNTQWTWPSGEYTIKRSALTYTATRGGQEVAAYTSLEEKVFSKNELATLKFFVDMPSAAGAPHSPVSPYTPNSATGAPSPTTPAHVPKLRVDIPLPNICASPPLLPNTASEPSVPQANNHTPILPQSNPSAPSAQASSTSNNPPHSNSNTVQLYHYQFHDAGNNRIRCESDPTLPTFKIVTPRGPLDIPKRTVVTCTIPDGGDDGGEEKAHHVVQGELDWKRDKITVGKVSKSMEKAMKKIGGSFSLDTKWTWPSGVYMIKHDSRTWKATRGGKELAVYTSPEVKAFSRDELASLRFLVNMPNEEKVFLIFALMFHELQKRPPVKLEPFEKTFGDAALEFTASAATATISTVMLNNCCVVQ
ncbi:hypothetical protein D9756_003654 [Leucocoprinus leucothites]|uniref:Uncharacterized protein n=1 Tax=Leucocoprinus leucothites TaxID=201217 RepID=A0A8H5G7J5_9AGAR|nr:hypothetical protein D9756_003654 [Leucoagaricus leucothites]